MLSIFAFKEILSASLVLFSVIDIFGSIPVILSLKKKMKHIHSEKITIISGMLMFAFLFIGEKILDLFNIDASSFAIAGSIVMLLLGLEMVLGLTIFRYQESELDSGVAVVPIAFPLIAGAGTMTTLISLPAEFAKPNIIVGILLNLVLVYGVLRSIVFIERLLGVGGINIIRKIFGIILLALAVKIFKKGIL